MFPANVLLPEKKLKTSLVLDAEKSKLKLPTYGREIHATALLVIQYLIMILYYSSKKPTFDTAAVSWSRLLISYLLFPVY